MVEDVDDPENPLHLTAGDVMLVDEGTVNKFSSPSKGRGELSNFPNNNLFAKPPRLWYFLHTGTSSPYRSSSEEVVINLSEILGLLPSIHTI